jgi:predicted nucleic acid-binding protein
MTYLLDVNALLALGFLQHEFSDRLAVWIRSQRSLTIATCSITEMGFLRILSSIPTYGVSLQHAQSLLSALKNGTSLPCSFLPDDQDVSRLPSWVKTPKQVTDGHLLQLAASHSIALATFDEKIPGAFVIPR